MLRHITSVDELTHGLIGYDSVNKLPTASWAVVENFHCYCNPVARFQFAVETKGYRFTTSIIINC